MVTNLYRLKYIWPYLTLHQAMKRFLGLNGDLLRYVEAHKLPDLYEALLSGLAIMCPSDPLQFIKDCLEYLSRKGAKNITWDMFIEESMHPVLKPGVWLYLRSIFDYEDGISGPEFELLMKAYDHYQLQVQKKIFWAWLKYISLKKLKRQRQAEQEEQASRHYDYVCCLRSFCAWKRYVDERKQRRSVACSLIKEVHNSLICKRILTEWLQVTQLSKKTREYFERLERGEKIDESLDEDISEFILSEGRDDVSLLPNNLAVKIFSHLNIYDLTQCAFVCRSWRILVQNIALLSRVNLSGLEYRVTDRVMPKLLSKCRPYIVHANLRGCAEIRNETFYALRECRNLQDLNLSAVPNLNDEAIRLISEGCKILLYLNVSHTNITDDALRTISVDLINLQYISLAGCKLISDKGLTYLATGGLSKRLIYLDLSACTQFTYDGFAPLAEGCRNIQHLILNDLPTLDDTCLSCFTRRCKKLQSLSLLRCGQVSCEVLAKFASSKKLRHLAIETSSRLYSCYFLLLRAYNHTVVWSSSKKNNISHAKYGSTPLNNFLKLVGKKLRFLRYLSLVNCRMITDAGLSGIAFCGLTVLNLTNCFRITDNGMRKLLEAPCGVKLKELNLTNCVCISDLTAVNILKRAFSLSYLSLAYCDRITDIGIESLSNHQRLHFLDISGSACTEQGMAMLGRCQTLRDVNLCECLDITDDGIEIFVQDCSYIERLDLSNCKNITDIGVKNLAFHCRFLTHLSLAGCSLLTDRSIQYLAISCKHLISLNLSGCNGLSDKSMKHIKEGFYRLKTLSLLYCGGISSYAVRRISRHIKHVYHCEEPLQRVITN